jgi:hypothetical protein
MLRAIPEQDSQGILDHVAFDFVADDGLDYAGVQSLVHEFLGRDELYSAELEELRIERFSPVQRLARFARYRFALRFTKRVGRWSARGGSYARITSRGG